MLVPLGKPCRARNLSEIAMSAAAPVGSIPRGWELLAVGVGPIDPCHLMRAVALCSTHVEYQGLCVRRDTALAGGSYRDGI